MNNFFDAKHEAINIIIEHTVGFMESTEYIPVCNDELIQTIMSECARILVEDWLNGQYTAIEFNAIRNELAKLLWKQF